MELAATAKKKRDQHYSKLRQNAKELETLLSQNGAGDFGGAKSSFMTKLLADLQKEATQYAIYREVERELRGK